jgi:cysteinyl-tRNA synthetase
MEDDAVFAQYWLHNGFVTINREKMSKSLGNFFTVREVLERYPPEVVRFFIVSSHYRGPLNYSDENLDHARASLTRLYTALRGLPRSEAPVDPSYQTRFDGAMDDDFNTAEALAVLFDLAREINRLRDKGESEDAARLGASLRQLGDILGLLQDDPDSFLKGSGHDEKEVPSAADIEQLIAQRNAARKTKNWAEADRIRNLLAEQGIVLEDTIGGTTWRRG